MGLRQNAAGRVQNEGVRLVMQTAPIPGGTRITSAMVWARAMEATGPPDKSSDGVRSASFGSMRASQTLGIIWNDQMDDFSTPGVSNAFGFAPSETNFIKPGKRPMSSMSPMVVYNKNDNNIVMVVGASGGSYIISATAQAVIRTMLFNQTVKDVAR
ncbi:hypothetical protein TELCIR_01451 [Teladorsagia circumcincta]|uniref:Gamma-glutamyltranspeptidase n=1 Tax=Teladorsagia circumcincta TaxID=45464 RepID=A0A2G9V1V6_TELCI|nr:hypothetical protein TELCIR_01451 [Teladorsagia circumcincta]